MSIVIAPIALSNADSFRACFDAVAREKKYLAEIEAPPCTEMTAWIRSSIAHDDTLLVALDGQQVVGWAEVVPSKAHAVAHRGDFGMGVLAVCRGQGVGKRLILACIDCARSKGITRIELEARADNVSAIRLYESVGFKFEATRKNAMRFDGIHHDVVQMCLDMDEASPVAARPSGTQPQFLTPS